MTDIAFAETAIDENVAPEIEEKNEKINFASQLPEPRGYKLLIALPEVDDDDR